MPAAWSARGNSWGKGAAGGGVGAPAGTGRSQRTPAALLQGVAGRPSWGWGKGPPGLGSWASKLVRGGRELGIAATVSKARLLRTEEWAWRNQCGRPHSWAPGPSCALGHALVPPWTLSGLVNSSSSSSNGPLSRCWSQQGAEQEGAPRGVLLDVPAPLSTLLERGRGRG